MMMCWLAKLEVRRVFVQRDLRPAEWRRFETAAAAVSKLPLRFADAHGASTVELEDAFCRSLAETRVEHRLLVTDHLDAPPKPTLPHLEQLSAVVRVPVLVLFDTNEPFGQPPSVHETGLRPGSRVLVLERPLPSSAFAKEDAPGEDSLVLRVQAVGSGGGERAILLKYDAVYARIRARP